MKYLNTNPEILNKFKYLNFNFQNVLMFVALIFRNYLEIRNLHLGFTTERSC